NLERGAGSASRSRLSQGGRADGAARPEPGRCRRGTAEGLVVSPLSPRGRGGGEEGHGFATVSDRPLIRQIRQGDPRSWDTLIARYEGRLLAFVDRRLHDRAASEDVVQEAFIGFLNSLPNYDEARELQTYLFTIASHKLTDHLR